jgi:hypothetical protein
VTLAAGSCYRFLAVRNAPSEEVELGFKHSEEVMERGTDYFDLTPEQVEPTRAGIWGMCVWPAHEGEVTVYHNLAGTGGAILVLEARASGLAWKLGEDVKLYLAGTGAIDLEDVEKEEATGAIVALFQKDQAALPAELEGRSPFYNDILSTREPSWSHSFTTDEGSCYHVFVASANCRLGFGVVNAETGKSIHDDGAPDEAGRHGWGQDFCPPKKQQMKEAKLEVELELEQGDYDKCWFGASLYSYVLTAKQKKQLEVARGKERQRARLALVECRTARKACTKACKGSEDPLCKDSCEGDYSACVDGVDFEGQIGLGP